MPDVVEQLSRYAAAVEDAVPPVGVDEVRSAPSRRSRRAVLAVAAVVVLAVATAVLAWPSDDRPSSITTVDAPPQPTTDERDDGRPPTTDAGAPPALGSAAEPDPALRLEPDGPYRDGQLVTLTWPAGHVGDPWNERPVLCALVADEGDEPTETCDPLGEAATDGLLSTEATVRLRRRVFTPTGYRDCSDTAVTCRLLHRRADGTYGATDPLRFEGSAEPPEATLSVTGTDDPQRFVVDPDGLAPHPSWTELRETDPARAAGWAPFSVQLCAFGSSPADVAPYGTYLWLDFDSLSVNCDATGPGVPIDPDDPNGPVAMTISGRIQGYAGWSDCRTDHCFVQIRRTVVDGVDPEALTGHDDGVVADLVPFAPTTALPDPPEVEVLEPGPHSAGQTVTVAVRGLPEGTTTNVGACDVAEPWQCWYPAEAFDLPNGMHRITLPDAVASCGPDQCYLELDSEGEGLPPLATTPLDTGA